MAMNRSYDPPISSPPDGPPGTICQVNTESPTSAWGAIRRNMSGGMDSSEVGLQRSVIGKDNRN